MIINVSKTEIMDFDLRCFYFDLDLKFHLKTNIMRMVVVVFVLSSNKWTI